MEMLALSHDHIHGADLDAELDELHDELEVIVELSRKNINLNARGIVNQEEWQEKNDSYKERHSKALARVNTLEDLKRNRSNKKVMLESFVRNLKKNKRVLDKFDEQVWITLVEKATIQLDGQIVFRFKDGTEIDIMAV